MPGLLPQVDPDGLLEYSVVYTDRALNHMSAKFQGVMRDISAVLKDVYKTTVFELCRWRNGHLPQRTLQTQLGDVDIHQPRVRRRTAPGSHGLVSGRCAVASLLAAGSLPADGSPYATRRRLHDDRVARCETGPPRAAVDQAVTSSASRTWRRTALRPSALAR